MARSRVLFLPHLPGVRIPRFLAALLLVLPAPRDLPAQETFGRILRSGDHATLSVYDGRPLEQAAQTLANEFALRVSAEDPLYAWPGDLIAVGRSNKGLPLIAPKPLLIETAFELDPTGQPRDAPALLESLIGQVNLHRPFAYRDDVGPAGYTIVPP
jgi:hypothetical protein